VLSVPVHAVVDFEVTGGTPAGDIPQFAPDDEVGFTGDVAPSHPDGHVVIVIKRLGLEGYDIIETIDDVPLDDLGEFASSWSGDAGTYRARAKFPADEDHSRGLSPEVDFVISDTP
jgi:hypothetical protein